jgi:hypothetical protein
MRIDARAEFSDAQAVTVDAISSNVMARDGLGLSPNDTQQLGAPSVAYLVITCAVEPDDGDTIQFSLESATNAALSSGAVKHWTSDAISTTVIKAGNVLAVIPLPNADYKDFIGVRYNVGTGPMTVGKYNAFLTLEPQTWRAFKHGSDSVTDYPAP